MGAWAKGESVGGAGRAEGGAGGVGGAGGAGGGPGHALVPLKSAEKPHPWAVDHEPMGPGAMGPVGGRVRGGVGVGVGSVGAWGWSRGHFLTGIGSHAG